MYEFGTNLKNIFLLSRSIVSSEISDEEFAELWARTVDLPGFDDNVSPNNTITSLFRCVMGEVVYKLKYSYLFK